jgi:hypothetical protein
MTTNPTQKNPSPQVPPPICPHCSGEIALLDRYAWECPPFLLLGFLCPHCRVSLHMTVMPAQVMQPDERPPLGGPRIVS